MSPRNEKLVNIHHGGVLDPVHQSEVAVVQSCELSLRPNSHLTLDRKIPWQDCDSNPSVCLIPSRVVAQNCGNIRPDGVIVEDEVGGPEQAVELQELQQPQSSVVLVVQRLHADPQSPSRVFCHLSGIVHLTQG